MNGSEHTVGGVGYAGEIHFIHRNLKYATLDGALKQPDGVVALAVFLNVIHACCSSSRIIVSILGVSWRQSQPDSIDKCSCQCSL